MQRGTRLEWAHHQLYFDPDKGFLVWLLLAASRLGLDGSEPVRLLDLAALGRDSSLSARDLDA
jgi:hypothetical protein